MSCAAGNFTVMGRVSPKVALHTSSVVRVLGEPVTVLCKFCSL